MTSKLPTSGDYTPPSGKIIIAKQDDPSVLRFLVAQRKLYSQSKRWLGLRLIGMGVIGIAAPLATLHWQNTAVTVGAVAGTWVFLGRTAFIIFEKRLSARAAAVQEIFDTELFGMSSLGERSPTASLEEIAVLVGPDAEIMEVARREKLLGWYAINPVAGGLVSVAICQRTNAAYSSDLLKVMAKTWLTAIGLWGVLLVALSLILHFSLSTFLLGILLPLLPAFLDTFEYWKGIKRASVDRASLSREIQEKIETNDVTGEDLLVWQSRMYELRRDAPQVPDFLYRLMRSGNERTMKSVATQLSNKIRRSKR
ncbi:MAG: S-4TM family putative pore-forming effector [Candidatus Saccharimonadales bacterium]